MVIVSPHWWWSARHMNSSHRKSGPSALMNGLWDCSLPCVPSVATLRRVVVPLVRRARTRHRRPLVSPDTRLGEVEKKATWRPSALSLGVLESLVP